MIETLLALCIGSVTVYLLANWLFHQWRDVHPLYLNRQLLLSLTRQENESPIYRSIKCDRDAPRVGLDIRYDSYKLRHGNLSDVWLLAVSHNSTVSFIYEPRSVNACLIHKMNALVKHILGKIQGSSPSCIEISTLSWLLSPAVFAAMIAAMISQTPIRLILSLTLDIKIYQSLGEFIRIDKKTWINTEDPVFENKYDPGRDQGVAIKYEQEIQKTGMAFATEFTQLNLVSAIASTLKHLSAPHELTEKDHVLIQLDESGDFIGQVVKVFASLISGSRVTICCTTPKKLSNVLQTVGATILVAPAKCVSSELCANSKPRLVNDFKASQLSRGIFWYPNEKGLRLIYASQSIFECSDFGAERLNRIRSATGARIVVERTHHSIAGPLILTDMFDYRVIHQKVHGYGAISQSLEIKLCDMKQNGQGRICVRGYTIGKETYGEGGGKERDLKRPGVTDGFMPLDLYGVWGKDGCLYVI